MERLQYISLLGAGSGTYDLVVYLDGGGARQEFALGATVAEVCSGLRLLAERLEHGAEFRKLPKPSTAAELRMAAEHDSSCVGAFARARPGR